METSMSDFTVSIRNCRPEDIEAVLKLWRKADATPSATDTPEDLRKTLTISSANVLIAKANKKLIGSLIGGFDGWRGNMYRLVVHPDYRRRGIARQLVAEAEKRLVQHGVKRITALVEKDHPWAVRFWEAVGYGMDHRI